MFITERDKQTAAETATARQPALEICPKCGWYEHTDLSPRQCDPEAGALADQLIASMPHIRSGKLGYGQNHVVFEIDEDTSIVFEISNNVFSLEGTGGVFCLHNFGHESAKELVLAIDAVIRKNFK